MLDPHNSPFSTMGGFDTFDPYQDPISTVAAMYGGDPCDPSINVNCGCLGY